MPSAFLDTSGLIALANTRDVHHVAAIAARRKLSLERSRFFTTQWVLAEFLGSMAYQATRPAALRIVDRILASPRTACITAEDSSWTAALDLYRARPDKEWWIALPCLCANSTPSSMR